MKIVACVKRVPTTDLQPKVAADGKSLETGGTQYMTSFYDEIAVEEAVKTKEAHGGEVTVLSLGAAGATKEIRECLAKGADDAVVLDDANWAERDSLATAKVLAEKIKAMGAELVFTGRVATDRDQGAVGPMIATLLGWACVTDIVEVQFDGAGGGTAKREADGGLEIYRFNLPAVLTCQKDLNEPRYAGLKGIMAAKKKPLAEEPTAVSANTARVDSLELPPTRQAGRIVGEGADAVPALIDALRNEAQVL